MATVTPGKVFNSNEIVTPTNLNALGVPTVALANSEVTTAKIADANVTTAKLATLTQQALLPAGAIMPFARTTAPSGWLIANGNVVPNGSGSVQGVTTDYTALYSAVGTSFGAAGTLPDLRGYFVRGAGTNTDGIASGDFGQKQGNTVGPHTHSGTTAAMNQNASHSHSIKGTGLGQGGIGANPVFSSNYTTDNASSIYATNIDHLHTFTTSSQNPTGTTETRPANIALLYCIKI